MTCPIRLAETDADILGCFPVMFQLRPHLVAAEFVHRIRRQITQGFQLAFGTAQRKVVCVAGFRVHETLFGGLQLYVDDLVTDEAARSCGHGAAMFAWLVQQAKSNNCDVLALDSGVQRFDAHRFYLAMRMNIACHHFRLKLQ